MRREFGFVLLLGAVGAALVVFAVRQTWAQAIFTPPRPLPAQEISVTGQQLVPLAGALALAALACLAAVIAPRSAARAVASHAIVIAGSHGQAVIVGAPWHAAAIVGAVAVVLAGLAAVWRGPRWPVMSARFERPGQRPRRRAADSASMWESLSRDLDPTVETAVEDQVGGG